MKPARVDARCLQAVTQVSLFAEVLPHRSVEGCHGLIVHGPVQALCSATTPPSDAPPRRFSFRRLSPLFDDAAFALHAIEEGAGLKLWTAKQNGTLCMTAEIIWS